MNAALLLMTSTVMVGADAAPAAAPPAPTVVSAGPGCNGPGCGGTYGPISGGAYCDPCAKSARVGCLEKLKAKFAGKNKGGDCGCAPAPVACDTCNTSAARPNLFDKIKGRCGKHQRGGDCGYAQSSCDGCATSSYGGCATPLPPGAAPVAPAPSPVADPPKDMPKVKDPVKTLPKVGASSDSGIPSIPNPGAVVVPGVPITPVSAPRLTGTVSPY